MKTKTNGTQIYGTSDDLVEFDGECAGEVGAFGTDDADQGVLVLCSDGTVAEVKYGKNGNGIWGINVLRKGSLFDRIELCDDEDDDPYSDQLFLKPGIKWIYAAKDSWELVQ